MSVEEVLNSSSRDEQKIAQLRRLVEPDHDYNVSGCYQGIVQLIQIERLLCGEAGDGGIDKLFKSVQHEVSNKPDYLARYVRLWYHDLLSDYQYLVQEEGKHVIELINKKILIHKACSVDELSASINQKIVYLLVISPYDFRKLPVMNYITNANMSLSPAVETAFRLVKDNRLVPVEAFNQFLALVDGLYKLLFRKLDLAQLLANLLENNIVTLTKYYTSIQINQIYAMFGLDPATIDVELIIASMIIKNKFQSPCKIDQINNIVIFDDGPVANPLLKDHILQVGTLATNLANQIE